MPMGNQYNNHEHKKENEHKQKTVSLPAQSAICLVLLTNIQIHARYFSLFFFIFLFSFLSSNYSLSTL